MKKAPLTSTSPSKRNSTAADVVTHIKPPTRFTEVPPPTGIIDHFISPPMMPRLPWELSIEERQRISKDPRTMKQMSDIDRWDNTPLKHIWARIRSFALAKKDWVMTGEEVGDWLKSEGVKSELVVDRLLDVFYPKEAGTLSANEGTIASGIAASSAKGYSPINNFGGTVSSSNSTNISPPATASKTSATATNQLVKTRAELRREEHRSKRYNAIILCKYLELGITTRPYSDLFIQHCFDQFDRPLGTVRLSKTMIFQSNIKTPVVGKKSKGSAIPKSSSTNSASPPSSPNTPRKGKKSKGPLKMGSGATYPMIEPLKRLIEMGEFDITQPSRNPTAKLPAINDIIKKVSDRPLAMGHSPTFIKEELQAMKKNYDTLPPPEPQSSLEGTSAQTNSLPITADDITYEMFRAAFLDPRNSEWVAAFTLPLLECCLKYFSPPAGALPLVSLKWLKDISAVPVSEVQHDADSALLREIEELGYDPWAAPKKKRSKSPASQKAM